MTDHLGDLALGMALWGAAIGAASLGVLLKREVQQAVAYWKLGRSLMRRLDESIKLQPNCEFGIRIAPFTRETSRRKPEIRH